YSSEDVYIERQELVTEVSAVYTEWTMFQLSETNALIGRTLQPFDHREDAEPVALIGFNLWQSFFDGAESVVGSSVSINDVLTRIVGIMPEGYLFPDTAQLWLPISDSILQPLNNDLILVRAFGKLDEAYTRKDANDEINRLMLRTRELYPAETRADFYDSEILRRINQVDSGHVTTFQMRNMGGVPGLIALGAINLLSLLVFLLACINVGALLLSRVNERLRDVSIRVALGAPRRRLLLQTMSESMAISVLGGIIAVLLAGIGLELLNFFISSLVEQAQFWFVFAIDSSTLLAVVVFVVCTPLITSALPCWRIINGDFNAAMSDGTRGAQGLRSSKFSKLLVIVAITLVTLLLYVGSVVGAGAYRFKQALSVTDGEDQILSSLQLSSTRYSDEEQIGFYRSLLNSLEQSPDVSTPLLTVLRGRVNVDALTYGTSAQSVVSTEVLGSLAAYGHQLLEGRPINAGDVVTGAQVAVISSSLANRLWPDRSAIGQELRISEDTQVDTPSLQIVGVVSDSNLTEIMSRQLFLNSITEAIYTPLKPSDMDEVIIQVAHRGDEDRTASELHRAIQNLDSTLIYDVGAWESRITAGNRAINSLIGVIIGCGLFSFLVAIAGIYGLTKNFIDLQVQEIGTRRALGAADTKLQRTFVFEGGKQALIGFVAALIITSPITFFLFIGTELTVVDTNGALVIAAVACILLGTVLSAIVHPIREILKLEPIEALRHQ
ncbi:MAG: ABC transporter permease, partial [Pseudomonadales bacterium]|nr:ABC transporter permease [Pseudomonadales bacterium]